MRTILALAIGFWISRQLYLNYDKKKSQKREIQIRKQLLRLLKEQGMNEAEIESVINSVWHKNTYPA